MQQIGEAAPRQCLAFLLNNVMFYPVCFPPADGGEEGGPTAASSKEDAGEELKESGGAAAERAGALPADAAAAVPTGHPDSARMLPALSPLCEYTRGSYNLCTCTVTCSGASDF